ncbi:DUF2935 domain-containing protein [Sinanaerobacter chloroacetimidivorans]|jgi:hypothetical protein|uniref:DUF2935 domain-containing protein n=1 Tax=Sinanaerobacter chloroacetimidivorans TaxID=2818044 RepID=A0A8J8B394_9FIRM|nr:DUF2935 domain-containing protein [Sinanaerobacter chloroacetimidivorans]MBR0599561.1 DUF2935 domain-containing protein [Sinanaerobacter chloroacetimidivorans]
MLTSEEFVRMSLEANLFWIRIMKEHAIFIESVILPPERQLALEADNFKQQFEALLEAVISQSNGFVTREALHSGEFYTRYTDEAERLTQQYTGIAINRNLTLMETNIEPMNPSTMVTDLKAQEVFALNQRILSQMQAFLQFQTNLLNRQASCQIFTLLYTSVIEHVVLEGRDYYRTLTNLQNKTADMFLPQDEFFWNRLMADHAKAIRGLLDPVESDLFYEANRFANYFSELLEKAFLIPPTDENPLIQVREFGDFKGLITQGLISCKVEAIMLSLYTDHLLREANHYIRLLQTYQ